MNDITQDSMFDPTKFLEETEISGNMAIKSDPIPVGTRANFQIESYTIRKVVPDDPAKKPFVTLEVDCVVGGDSLDPLGKPIKETTGKDKNYARYKGFVDLTPSGSWDLGPGANVALGKLREALGQNNPSQPWKLPMLKGQVFSAEVIHRQNEKNPDQKFAELRNPLPPQ